MLVSIPTYSNMNGLVALLVNLQPQLKPTDLIHICDTHPDRLSVPLVQLFGSSRCPIILDCGVRGIYEAWNAGIEFMKDNHQEGILILNDDVLLPMTAIESFRKIAKQEWAAIVPNTPDRTWKSRKLDPNFKWYSQGVPTVEETDWMCGFAFYLPKKTVDAVGVFDTKFDVWFGDTDYEERVKAIGKIGKISSEYVYHFGGSSYEYKSPEVKQKIANDGAYFLKKHERSASH